MALLEDKVVVITGGTRGFGMAMAQAFAQDGAKVVVGSRSHESVNRAVSILQSHGAVASGRACDIAQRDQVQALADHALEVYGQFDVWVNNAALSAPYGPTFAIDTDAYLTVMRTNMMGTYFGSLVAIRHFLSLGQGKLINILGVGDRKPAPMQSAYGASKAWALNFTLALAEECQGSGVDVFAFQPGMMDTDLLKNVEVVEGFESRLDRLETVIRDKMRIEATIHVEPLASKEIR